MVKILIGRLARTFVVAPGDMFNLVIDGEVVHSRNLDTVERISQWAHVSMMGAEGYFVGGDNLEEVLRSHFTAPEFTYKEV